MEIVGQDETKKQNATCDNCGAKLSFYKKEILTYSGYSMGELEIIFYVVCPQCENQVQVKL